MIEDYFHFLLHTYNILAVSRMLKDLTNNDNFFGGKIVIFCGDPQQQILMLLELQATFVVDQQRILQFFHQKSYHYYLNHLAFC